MANATNNKNKKERKVASEPEYLFVVQSGEGQTEIEIEVTRDGCLARSASLLANGYKPVKSVDALDRLTGAGKIGFLCHGGRFKIPKAGAIRLATI